RTPSSADSIVSDQTSTLIGAENRDQNRCRSAQPMSQMGLGCAKIQSDLVVMPCRRQIFAFACTALNHRPQNYWCVYTAWCFHTARVKTGCYRGPQQQWPLPLSPYECALGRAIWAAGGDAPRICRGAPYPWPGIAKRSNGRV